MKNPIETKKTQVLIVGGGPAGMLLAHMLNLEGIESVVIERQSRKHVLQRIRGGGMEAGTVNLLRQVGLNSRLDKESTLYSTLSIAYSENNTLKIDMKKYSGKTMTMYGQHFVTEDLYLARDAAGGEVIHNVCDVKLHDLTSSKPYATLNTNGKKIKIICDYIAGCDGSHGVSRQSIPKNIIKIYEKTYPFGWLSIVSETEPYSDFVYAAGKRGFALTSKRGPMLSRYFLQCNLQDKVEEWSDERFWTEFKSRYPQVIAEKIKTGPISEKTIAPLRSVVVEPMRYGHLFLAGDAAHIVPPTGAKGLNLAVSDIYYLSRALTEAYNKNNLDYLDQYAETALKRVWAAERFSWWMTNLLHSFPGETTFDLRMKESHFHYLSTSDAAKTSIIEQYVGLPF